MVWNYINSNLSVADNINFDLMKKELEFINTRSDTLPTALYSEPSSLSSSLSSSVYYTTHSYEDEITTQPLHLNTSSSDYYNDINFHYQILPEIIGEGSFGTVRQCIYKGTGEHFAVKSIPTRNIYDFDSFDREVSLLQQVDNHKNIAGLVDVFEDTDYIHVVTEICQGGELFDLIEQQKQRRKSSSTTLFSEAQAAGIIHSILDAVAYLHDKDIVHRDLKPENCMLQHGEIKLIDFGFAVTHDSEYDAPMTDVVGTPYYIAPEVLEQKYTKACDIWSVGVITYILLCGHQPFDGQDEEELFSKIKRGHFSLDENIQMSNEAKDFIKCLLARDPRQRWSAEEALEHPWMIQQLGINI